MLFEIAIPANHSAYDDGLSSLLFRAYFVAYTGLILAVLQASAKRDGIESVIMSENVIPVYVVLVWGSHSLSLGT